MFKKGIDKTKHYGNLLRDAIILPEFPEFLAKFCLKFLLHKQILKPDLLTIEKANDFTDVYALS